MRQLAIQLKNLTLGYGKHTVVQQLNIDIPQGSLLAVVGANGTGKSTLLKTLTGVLKPLQGHIHLQGFEPREIAYLPQRASLEQSFPMNVRDCVAMGLWNQIGAFGDVSAAHQRQIDEALTSVGLGGIAQEPLSSLSGGQLQRVLFARLLLQDACVILLDEPFNAIDEQTIQDLMVLIKQWHRQGRTVLSVLHDLELVRHHFTSTLCLADGHGTIGKTHEVLKQRSQHRAA